MGRRKRHLQNMIMWWIIRGTCHQLPTSRTLSIPFPLVRLLPLLLKVQCLLASIVGCVGSGCVFLSASGGMCAIISWTVQMKNESTCGEMQNLIHPPTIRMQTHG